MTTFRLTDDQRAEWIRLQIERIDTERAAREITWEIRRGQLRAMLVRNGPDVLDSGCDCEEGSPCSDDHMDRALDLHKMDATTKALRWGAWAVAGTNLADFELWAEDAANELRIEEGS